MGSLPSTGLHVSGRFNSTQFTDCCGVAATERDRACPSCRRPIRGREEPERMRRCEECQGTGWTACGPFRSATCGGCHGRRMVRDV